LPALLNKDVLTQVEVLVALRTIAPQDRAAIDAWIQAHDALARCDEILRRGREGGYRPERAGVDRHIAVIVSRR
jgi:hypothetical protein